MVNLQGINLGDAVRLEYKWTSFWSSDERQNQVVGYVRELNYKKIILQERCLTEKDFSDTEICHYKLDHVFSCERLNRKYILLSNSSLPDEKLSGSTEQSLGKKIELKGVTLGDLILLNTLWRIANPPQEIIRGQYLGFVVKLNTSQISLVNYNPQNTPPPVRYISNFDLSRLIAYQILKKEDFSAPTAEDSSKDNLPILQPETAVR